MTTMRAEDVNKAILQIISYKFKNECPEAHKLVQAAGYEVYKRDGWFVVRNFTTSKRVYRNDFGLKYSKFSGYDEYIDNPDKFDFIGYLEKPFNREFYRQQFDYFQNRATEQYSRLRDKKRQIKWAQRDLDETLEEIEKLQAKVAELQQSLVTRSQAVCIAKDNYAKYRDELGLGA